MTLYFVDLDRIAFEFPPIPEPTIRSRVQETMGVIMRCFPRVVGIRRLRSAASSSD
jgi:hypothetical protein